MYNVRWGWVYNYRSPRSPTPAGPSPVGKCCYDHAQVEDVNSGPPPLPIFRSSKKNIYVYIVVHICKKSTM